MQGGGGGGGGFGRTPLFELLYICKPHPFNRKYPLVKKNPPLLGAAPVSNIQVLKTSLLARLLIVVVYCG